jgi:hypothetical protein
VYRPGQYAQQAVVEVDAQLFRGHPEGVDADLADYFGDGAASTITRRSRLPPESNFAQLALRRIVAEANGSVVMR